MTHVLIVLASRYQHVRPLGTHPRYRTRSRTSQINSVGLSLPLGLYERVPSETHASRHIFFFRLLVHTLGGEGYLNFEGNEFGHPEVRD